MKRYEEAYDELSGLCQAVNSNIKHFQGNFDLLTLLSFLKSLDAGTLERKHFLGGEFHRRRDRLPWTRSSTSG